MSVPEVLLDRVTKRFPPAGGARGQPSAPALDGVTLAVEAGEIVDAFDAARARWAGKTWREGRTFEKAYLIDLFQEMLERGSAFHRVDTHGGYMEIDTREDLATAEKWWRESAPE